mmetsp:Transcript_54042/g.131197  ORF Transcript_54042/g.131197 Transcript_54042/m.131197 type:complete len:160 (-) Transcript_54042:94-573(-)
MLCSHEFFAQVNADAGNGKENRHGSTKVWIESSINPRRSFSIFSLFPPSHKATNLLDSQIRLKQHTCRINEDRFERDLTARLTRAPDITSSKQEQNSLQIITHLPTTTTAITMKQSYLLEGVQDAHFCDLLGCWCWFCCYFFFGHGWIKSCYLFIGLMC